MKKVLCLLLTVFLGFLLAAPAMAASEKPVITLQPQSPNYPEHSVAIYTVKAEGANLQATWYLDWLGKTYNISDLGGSMQDWEPFAGESYGPRKLDDNTFAFIFGGIELDLDGAYIWCVIGNGHYDVTSQKNRISVGNENMPPEILSIPSEITVEQDAEAEIRCISRSPDGSQLTFLWYETETGHRADIAAVNEGTETSDFLFCDTAKVGTRYYICMVETGNGGIAFSSTVAVTVTEKQAATEPTQPPTTPPTQPPTQSGTPSPTTPGASNDSQSDNGIPLWVLLLAALGAAGAGFGAAVFIGKKKL